jgi:uncharacterized protein YjfI (DUF2170 family)
MCVLAELEESWEYLMVICWNFGAIQIYLEMSEHMATVDTVCSRCYVEVTPVNLMMKGLQNQKLLLLQSIVVTTVI